jgi:hypothetical protein
VQAIADEIGIDLAGNAVSQITRIELLSYPMLSPDDEKGIKEFLQDCSVLVIDDHVEAGAIAFRNDAS